MRVAPVTERACPVLPPARPPGRSRGGYGFRTVTQMEWQNSAGAICAVVGVVLVRAGAPGTTGS